MALPTEVSGVMAFAILSMERGRRRGRSTRTSKIFSAHLLGYLASHYFLEEPPPERTIRPLRISLFGSDLELRPFLANFRDGTKASTGSTPFQVLKTAGFRWTIQKVAGGAIATGYQPRFFHLEPTPSDDPRLRFIVAPPRRWVEEQAKALRPQMGDDAEDAVRAALFSAFLDRRTPLPILQDLRFQLRILRAAKDQPWHFPHEDGRRQGAGLWGEGIEPCGLDDPFAVSVDPSTLEEFLIHHTSAFVREENLRHGKARVPENCRLLPGSVSPATQLRFDFAVA